MSRDPLNVEVDNSSIVCYQFVFVPAWVSEFSGVLYFVLLFLKVFNCSVDVVKQVLSWLGVLVG